jgi:hypothetical protein
MAMASFTQRLIGAAKLDVHTYEEVEADTTALKQALGVVVLSSVAAGIGASGQGAIAGLLGGLVAALLGWFIWAWLTYIIGTRLLPTPQTHADLGQLLRTTGFAAAPGIARVVGIVPGLYGVVTFVTAVWMLAAFVVAVRQALDYTSTLRAVGVCLIGWIAYGIIFFVIGLFLGSPVAGG